MPFQSKEIRWFSTVANPYLIDWFEARGQTFDNITGRTDKYLLLPCQNALGIKWREGRIEIKQRTAEPEEGKISERATGCFEHWTKWSFGLAENGEGVRIANSLGSSWLSVVKERLGVVLSYKNGDLVLSELGGTVPAGCQLEYTRVGIGGLQWHSFGLEWFGRPWIPLPDKIVDDILGPSEYGRKESMGYAEFLAGNNFKN